MTPEKLKDWHEALPLVQAIYAEHGAGCCWHIVLDDQNVRDDHVEFCAEQAGVGEYCRTPDACRALGPLMQRASVTQRMKLATAPNKRG